MAGRLVIAAVGLALPMAAFAQTGVSGQQQTQPSANQNQPQMQTTNSQQPPNETVLPPTASSQTQPNPQPQLAK